MKYGFVTLAITAVLLSGCSGVKDQLGLNKSAPDEFSVVTRAPLSVPPNYELRPPAPGTQRPQEATTDQQAKQVVFETSMPGVSDSAISKSSLQSPVEQMLLQSAGATTPNSDIRTQIDREAGQLLDEEEKTVNKLLFWKDEKPTEVLVDPAAEAKRLEQNAAQGKPVTEGETPQSRVKDEGLIKILQ